MYMVRPDKLRDPEKIAGFHVEMWKEVYHFMPPGVFEVRDFQYRLNQWKSALKPTVLRHNPVGCIKDFDQLVGFWQLKKNRDNAIPNVRFELHACYLRRELRGTLVGPMCLSAMVESILAVGGRSATVWVFRQNPLKRTYLTLGFEAVVFRDRVIGGHAIPEIGMIAHDLPQLRDRVGKFIERFAGGELENLSRFPAQRFHSGERIYIPQRLGLKRQQEASPVLACG